MNVKCCKKLMKVFMIIGIILISISLLLQPNKETIVKIYNETECNSYNNLLDGIDCRNILYNEGNGINSSNLI